MSLDPNLESRAPEIALQFSRFAPYYDKFMKKYVNYRSWVQYLLRIFRRYQVKPKLLLDVACGTGIPTIILARQGYRLIGVDRSETMLNVLRAKSDRMGQNLRLIQADMRDFTAPEPADVAYSLYDSVNYLLTPDDLKKCFHAVARNLKPNGLWVFDMNTIFGLATQWGDGNAVREVGDIYSVWQTRFDPDTNISVLHLTFYVLEEGKRMRYDEIHEERGYRLGEIEQCLAVAGFRQCDFYHHGSFAPPQPTTSRLMIVARK